MNNNFSSKKRKNETKDHGHGQKKHYKYSGGDNVSILATAPREVRIADYAKSHAVEIESLSAAICRDQGGKNITQQLPKHMRRRAMSHKIKRLPRSIHAMAKSTYANQEGQIKKKPSRFHRRRPKNLLKEYTRRQRKHVWLETHIWHAKRFHMVEKWGFKLPWKPTEKSERAAYRATSRHCLLQDLSYMCCVEVIGQQADILDGLAHITSVETGQTFAAVSCLNGTKEGHTMIYKFNKYPLNAIGPVSFMWNLSQPISEQIGNETTNQKQLWIWCHPCCFDQIWHEFLKCLELMEVEVSKKQKTDTGKKGDTDVTEDTQDRNDDNKKSSGKDEEIIEPFIVDKYKSNVTASNKSKSVTMKSLAGDILRFSLTGPQSTAVLVDALQQANIMPYSMTDSPDLWWKTYYANNELSLGHVTQREFFESVSECQSPAELSPGSVVATTVRDPRMTRPVKRTKIESRGNGISRDMTICNQKITPEVSRSALWNATIREEVIATKQTDHKIHELKSEHLVPGTLLELGDQESRIPVIIIQKPGVVSAVHSAGSHDPNQGRGSGWDILLPKGWGMPFWLSLVFRGARCGGLREGECIAYEEKSLLFPNDFPDTQAGSQHQVDLERAMVDKYNRRPPAKRPNFTKFGVVSPFSPPWKWLLKELDVASNPVNDDINKDGTECKISDGHTDVEKRYTGAKINISAESEIFVLRKAKLIRRLQGIRSHGDSNTKGFKHEPKVGKLLKEIIIELEKCSDNSLIPIRVDMLHKGTPEQYAMVCIPSEADLELLSRDKTYGGPVEPLHKDPLELEKQKLKKDLKQKNINKKVKVDRTMKVIGDQEGVVVNVCSRKVIGYLNSGGFSLGTGNGGGVGLVAVEGLLLLLKNNSRWTVLVRNTSTLQYRFARISVVM